MTLLALFVRFFIFASYLGLQAVCSYELFVNTYHVQGHCSVNILVPFITTQTLRSHLKCVKTSFAIQQEYYCKIF